MKVKYALPVALLSVFLLSACASQSVNQNPDEITFPELSTSYLKTGAFIEPSAFERIQPGLDRDQVRLVLGNPHFNEGLFPKDIWNYAFNFKTGSGNEYITCQYQVHFANVEDESRPQPASHEDKVATRQSLLVAEHWQSPSCKAIARSVVEENPIEPVATSEKRMELSTDAFFAFGASNIQTLNAQTRRSLESLVKSIKHDQTDIKQIKVIGHTDRIGSDASNYTLSVARANAIADYLIAQGVANHLITTEGRGSFEPVASCGSSTQVTPELIACLQPNRRVELKVRSSTF